jgi:diguanylate cyclase (GGDEF)-like protein/PAS domain S-box-containing protein
MCVAGKTRSPVQAAQFRLNEQETIDALAALDVLDSSPEAEFDALVKAASLVCGVPISAISLIDTNRQWVKASVGVPPGIEISRDIAFCAHAVHSDELLEVPDAHADPRFAGNPLLRGPQGIRFYAGAPLRLSGGERIGTLCVVDHVPRTLTASQREILMALSDAAARALEGRAAVRKMSQAARLHASATLLLLHSADAVIGVNADRRIDQWNPAAERLFGYTAAEAIGEPVDRLISPECLDEERALRLLWKDRPFTFDTVHRHRSGHEIQVSVTLVQALDADGVSTRTTRFVRDISVQKQVAAKVAESEAGMRLLTDNIPSMVAYWNRDLGCRFANRAYREWLGRTGSNDLPIPGSALPGLDFFGADRRHVEEVLAGHPQHFALTAPGADGVARHLVVDYVPDFLGGETVGFLVQMSDVTALTNSQRALQQSTAALHEAQRLGRIGSWEWLVDEDSTLWSPEMFRIAGADAGSRPPSHAERASLYTPESYALWQSLIDRALRLHESFQAEIEFHRGDDDTGWIDVRAEPVLDASGRVVAVRGTGQDISVRKKTELQLARTQDFLARTGTLAGVGGWEVDLEHMRVDWSDEVCRLHARPVGHRPSLDEALGYYTPASRPRIEKAVEIAMKGGAGFDLELQIVRYDGEWRWVRTVGSVDFRDGKPVRLAGAFQDITDKHLLAQKLAEQHELIRVTLQSIGDSVITTDQNAAVTWLNPVAERMTGWTAAEAKGRPLHQVFHIVHEQTRQPAEDPIVACMQHDKSMGLAPSTLLISRSGEEFGIQDSASPIRDDQGRTLGGVLVFHDVTEQRRVSGEMNYRATHDVLTGLVNRAEFEARLERALAAAQSDGSPHALMCIDLDQFKLVNDACGHAAGDSLLQEVARLLREIVRNRDTLARLGGDEFAVLLEHCTAEQAGRVAQEICDRMDDFRYLHDGKRFRIGTSIGLVPLDARWVDASAVMQAADSSCYAAKEAGRNRVHAWFDTDTAVKARTGDMKWATRLEQALDENRFVLFAQRIFALHGDTTLVNAEILLRMVDTDGSIISPASFLPAAERFNLATRVDKWVLKNAIDLLIGLPSLNGIGMVCINLSGKSVGDRAFHRAAFAILEAAGASICSKICIEITETAAVTNMADANRFIEQAHLLGIRIALDDFGAGSSSFGYLKSLAIDKLKIDGQFVSDVMTDPLDDVAVRCFIDVARVINVKTVAEFVDSAAVLVRMREMGVDYAQGFHLHRPELADEVFTSEQTPARIISGHIKPWLPGEY